MRTHSKTAALTLASLCLCVSIVQAQTWSALKNPPSLGLSNCMLLTDGGVMCQSGGSWLKLTPDITGSYLNGTWSQLASFPSGYVPDAYASAILADGRALVVGGEYNNGNFVLTNQGEIYDPKANSWSAVPPPPGITYVGDAPAVVLADGTFLLGSKLDQRLVILNPATLTWTAVNETGKIDGFNSEEGWVLLPDDSVFTLDVKNAPASERFIPSLSMWVSAGNTPVDLHTPTTSQPITVAPGVIYYPPGEIGPDLLLPNGTVFAVGGTGQTAIFTPPPANSTAPGTWILGPSMPAGLNVEDGPGAVLPDGNVLVEGSPGASGTGLKFFEFDGTNLVSVPAVPRANSDATYYTQLLVLPNGQVLFVDGSTTVELYSPSSAKTYNPSWAPVISSVPATLLPNQTYVITGTQFNGLSQGTAFGDESQNATNYPLVRITNNATGHVFYARTHGHSTMGVATGTIPVSTNFDVPGNVEAGASTIVVVANGIPSLPAAVTIVSTAPTVSSVSPTSGPTAGGTTVTISGSNFAAGVTVTFGGAAASVTAATSTSITVNTPAHAAGVVNIVVQNPNGQTATVVNGYTYTAPAPTISRISPTSGTRNGRTTVTISGSNFVAGATVTFGGSSATVSSLSASSIVVRTPSHSRGTVSVVVTNPGGQQATLTNAYTYR